MKAALALHRFVLPALLMSSALAFCTGAPVRAADPPAPQAGDRAPLVATVEHGKGRINYGAGLVKATGYGALPDSAASPAQAKQTALDAARADALRTLAMAVSAIQVTSATTVRTYQLANNAIGTRLSALLRSPREVSQGVEADGTAVVVVELPMYGANSVASVVLPEVLPRSAATAGVVVDGAPPVSPEGGIGGGASATAAPGADAWKDSDQPAGRSIEPASADASLTDRRVVAEPNPTPPTDNGPFTSLVVDCRGLNLQAIMGPKLIDTTGREIYGTIRVTSEFAIETGIVGYPRSMAEALRTARCGTHPLIVKALRPADKYRFNPAVALEDGDRILAANNRDHFLEATRVIFLVDPLK